MLNNKKKTRLFATPLWLFFIVLLPLTGCFKSPSFRPAKNEFSVLSYNLGKLYESFGEMDEQALASVQHTLKKLNPDFLILQGMGTRENFIAFRKRLKAFGLNYAHAHRITAPMENTNLAMLSRYPVLKTISHTNLRYSIKSVPLIVQRGIQETHVDYGAETPLIIFNVHFKSKDYLPTSQNEMRRNEARILYQIIGRRFKANSSTQILVAGTLNDIFDSATLRRLIGEGETALHDLNILDIHKNYWTWHDEKSEIYYRTDYLLTSLPLLEKFVPQKSFIMQTREGHTPLTHRPLYAVFEK